MRTGVKLLLGAAGVALCGLILMPASASAAGGGGLPGPQGPDLPGPDLWTNWGKTPSLLRGRLAAVELASGIPGLGRGLAVWAWSVGGGSFVPMAKNQSPAEVAQSQAAFARNPEWPQSLYSEQWAAGGSWGLFDLLAGAQAHAGIHDGWSPLINHPIAVLGRVDVQSYIAGWIVYRLVSGPIKVLSAGDPARTWAQIRSAAANPKGYVDESQRSQELVAAYYDHAAGLGIDLAELDMPTVARWPGARLFWERLQVLTGPDEVWT